MSFDDDAGNVSWVNLPITSSAPSGTTEAFSAQIDSNQILTVYSQADGSGGITDVRVVVGTSTDAILGSSNIPYGSLIVADGALCVDDGSASNCDDSALTRGQIYAESGTVTAIDVAENYPTREGNIEAGTILMLDPDNPVFVKTYGNDAGASTTPKTLIGIISTQPGLLLGGFGNNDFDGEKKVPVALSGRVPVKVSSMGGAIEIGDRITPSSIPGVGMKAEGMENTVGIALGSYNSGNDNEIGEILVFVDLQSQKLSSAISGGTITELDGEGESSFWQIDEGSGRIKYIAPIDLNDFDMIGVRAIRGSAGKWSIDANGRLVVEEVQTNKLCLGETCITENELKQLLGGFEASEPEPNTDTTPPTITLNGNNPAEIEIGSTYSDLGAIITDNVDDNLGYKVSVDDGPQIDISEVQIDTSTAGEHKIVFTATDQAGNTGTATRTVIVYNPASTPEPEPEPTPTPTPAPAPAPILGCTDSDANNYDIDATEDDSTCTYPEPEPEPEPDTTAPIITLNGADTINLTVGDTYAEDGATAIDDTDGDITGGIIISGDTVDTTTAGTYTITYNVSDTANNTAIEITRIVNVAESDSEPKQEQTS